MRPDRFQVIAEKYRKLRIAVAGDFCLDRYLEIDPAREEISIETGLPVHNVVRVRSQPGILLSGRPPSEPLSSLKRATRFIISAREIPNFGSVSMAGSFLPTRSS